MIDARWARRLFGGRPHPPTSWPLIAAPRRGDSHCSGCWKLIIHHDDWSLGLPAVGHGTPTGPAAAGTCRLHRASWTLVDPARRLVRGPALMPGWEVRASLPRPAVRRRYGDGRVEYACPRCGVDLTGPVPGITSCVHHLRDNGCQFAGAAWDPHDPTGELRAWRWREFEAATSRRPPGP